MFGDKEHNWEIGEERDGHRSVTINGEVYPMPAKDAGILHALLLILDGINDLTGEVRGK